MTELLERRLDSLFTRMPLPNRKPLSKAEKKKRRKIAAAAAAAAAVAAASGTQAGGAQLSGRRDKVVAVGKKRIRHVHSVTSEAPTKRARTSTQNDTEHGTEHGRGASSVGRPGGDGTGVGTLSCLVLGKGTAAAVRTNTDVTVGLDARFGSEQEVAGRGEIWNARAAPPAAATLAHAAAAELAATLPRPRAAQEWQRQLAARDLMRDLQVWGVPRVHNMIFASTCQRVMITRGEGCQRHHTGR